MNAQKYKSHAKVNLGLKIVNKREDGYHNIDSLFVELNLHDTISFMSSDVFSLATNFTDLPVDDSNLVMKAYNLLHPFKGSDTMEYSIHVEKKIPMGGGLGGGSSNAATTLKALNQLWECGYDDENLCKIGISLGADVPFFIKGGVQLIEGIGDILTPMDHALLKEYSFLLVVPPIHISTPWAYNALNKTLQPNKRLPKFPPLSKPMKWELFDNDFERVIRKTYPEISNIKEKLQNAGALYAGLSGSGSTVFGVFDNHQKAEALSEIFSPYQTFLSSPVFRC